MISFRTMKAQEGCSEEIAAYAERLGTVALGCDLPMFLIFSGITGSKQAALLLDVQERVAKHGARVMHIDAWQYAELSLEGMRGAFRQAVAMQPEEGRFVVLLDGLDYLLVGKALEILEALKIFQMREDTVLIVVTGSDLVSLAVKRIEDETPTMGEFYEKQASGVTAARERGMRFGRPQIPLPPGFISARDQWRNGSLTIKEAAERCGMPMSTFYAKARLG